jgi:Domain of unknown function (DUF4410)
MAIISKSILIISLALYVSACASGTITVLTPVTQQADYKTLKIESGTDTVTLPADARAHFEKRLNEYLYDAKSGFTRGDELTLRYRFIQFDEGSRVARYVIGFGAGKGKMTAEVVFTDRSGNELAKIHVEGEISMGFLGGDFDQAISAAARKVADYAIKTF